MRQYLYAYLQQAASAELPYLTASFRRADLGKEFDLVAADYHAQLLVPSLAKASAGQGRTWLRLLTSFYPEAPLPEIALWFAHRHLPTHFTLVFALSLQRVGFVLLEVQTMFLHLQLRDQLSAAIRLGFLGPLEGHRLQHDFYAVFDQLLATSTGLDYQQATRTAFLLEAAQGLHADLYSKLFQN
ncbi:urease accessory protein UreF [Hymenobacter radiodurans]|uniref:urease accessory protein UreF n=1 Tax=Hymenobacter radiodurans TaxID=2496028 RepID=UPI001404766F|nr:urease accessory UreF family protein [Hymenobacter radiodurans]